MAETITRYIATLRRSVVDISLQYRYIDIFKISFHIEKENKLSIFSKFFWKFFCMDEVISGRFGKTIVNSHY